jgi:hypothetical protein
MITPQDRTLDEMIDMFLDAFAGKRLKDSLRACLSQLDVLYTALEEKSGQDYGEMKADFEEQLRRMLE